MALKKIFFEISRLTLSDGEAVRMKERHKLRFGSFLTGAVQAGTSSIHGAKIPPYLSASMHWREKEAYSFLINKSAAGLIWAARFFTIYDHHSTAYGYVIFWLDEVNQLNEIDNISETVTCIQSIADVSLIAHCKEDELKKILSLLSDIAGKIDISVFKAAIYRQAEWLIAFPTTLY